jgi:hypothetical protein
MGEAFEDEFLLAGLEVFFVAKSDLFEDLDKAW